jgi:hypothetical protein
MDLLNAEQALGAPLEHYFLDYSVSLVDPIWTPYGPSSQPLAGANTDQAGPNTDPHMDPHTDPNTDPHMDPHTDPHMDPHTDPHTDPRMDPHTDPHTDPRMDPHADPHVGAASDGGRAGGRVKRSSIASVDASPAKRRANPSLSS